MREETINTNALRERIEGLRHMTVGQLKDKYCEVFGEESRSNHKQSLFRRIAWRIQANVEGGVSQCARRRAPQSTPRQRFAGNREASPRARGGEDSERSCHTSARDPDRGILQVRSNRCHLRPWPKS
jgi:hypothetical protein